MTTERAVLSVDFEFFTHTPAYRAASGATDEPTVGVQGLDFLLEAFDSNGARSTFFVVGSIGEEHPDLVERVAEADHEIGSHTHNHYLLTSLDEESTRDELERSREVLQDCSGQPVNGFRAPAFDLPPACFRTLSETGYCYDSSVMPSRRVPGWYGGGPDETRPVSASAIDPAAPSDLVELPLAVMPLLKLPLTGAWVRFFGRKYTIQGMRALVKRGIAPVLYLHPWELVDLPKVDGVPKRVYWRTGRWMRRTVELLLEQPYEFVTAKDIVAEV